VPLCPDLAEPLKNPWHSSEGVPIARSVNTFNSFDLQPWGMAGLKPVPLQGARSGAYLTVRATGALWVTAPEVPLIVSV
jgi:hypothetical protein